jgi:exosome complex RNA-binding protein Csl4
MERANMDVKEWPETALEIERIMAQVVKMEVGRPMQVAIVKGLKRKLGVVLASCL